MDDDRRRTLDLIEATVHRLSVEERGRQLVLVVWDYLDDGDRLNARRVLQKLERRYFEEFMPRHAVADPDLARAVADIFEVFGSDFRYDPRGSA